jgi:hypothetical protein
VGGDGLLAAGAPHDVHFAVWAGCTGAEAMAQRVPHDPKCDNHTTMTRLVYGTTRPPGRTSRSCAGTARRSSWASATGWAGRSCAASWASRRVEDSQRMGKMIEIAGPRARRSWTTDRPEAALPPPAGPLAENRAKARRASSAPSWAGAAASRKKPDGSGFDWCHKALNRLIQGSSADQTKKALVTMAEMFGVPLLQVHDEIDDSVPNAQAARSGPTSCVTACELEVPSEG